MKAFTTLSIVSSWNLLGFDNKCHILEEFQLSTQTFAFPLQL